MDDGRVVTGSRDNTLRVWNIDTGECDILFLGHTNSIRCLAVFGSVVVSGSYDFSVRVWDTITESCLHTFQDHHAQVYSVCFDGRFVCSGSLDADVRVWDLQSLDNEFDRRSTWLLEGHDALVGHMQLRGTTLMTGASDGRICLWDLESGELVRRFNAHTNSVSALAYDDNHIVSAGDEAIKVWTLDGKLVRSVVDDGVTGVWRLQSSGAKMIAAVQRSRTACLDILDFTQMPE